MLLSLLFLTFSSSVHAELVVRVSSLLPLWNVTLDKSLPHFHLSQIYDIENPVCVGNPSFVSETGALSEFCIHGVHKNDLTWVLGHEWWWKWESEVVQNWANKQSAIYDEAYDVALRSVRYLHLSRFKALNLFLKFMTQFE